MFPHHKVIKRKQQSKYPKVVTMDTTLTATSTQHLKMTLCAKLAEFGKTLTENKALEVALTLDINWRTVQRYCSGNIKDVRRTELAEKILAELQKS